MCKFFFLIQIFYQKYKNQFLNVSKSFQEGILIPLIGFHIRKYSIQIQNHLSRVQSVSHLSLLEFGKLREKISTSIQREI